MQYSSINYVLSQGRGAQPILKVKMIMSKKTITRTDLSEAVYQKLGLSRIESAELVESVLDIISEKIVNGESVKLSSFGSFMVRSKNERIGRNPKTGEEVPITPRRVMVFKPSNILKDAVLKGNSKPKSR